MSDKLRAIPAVEKLLQALGPIDFPRPLVVSVVRRTLATLRQAEEIPAPEVILDRIQSDLAVLRRSRLSPVINATGIVVHTNLGRSPLASPAVHALAEIASDYSNLEIDLESGERGQRAAYLEQILALLCEAESATVVNNCAAALVLALRVFTRQKREVIISRGELVQIGGGFRIPEILECSGARLREVGTTNQTTLEDYANAIGEDTALVLKVHHSNFRMTGFVQAPSRRALAQLAHSRAIPLMEDLGSGAMKPTEQVTGLEHEPTPAEVLREGVDLVCFSGDKLLGGPQSGVLAGQAGLIRDLKRDPFFRALRCDKLILTALQATAELYLAHADDPPVATWQLLRLPVDELMARASEMILELTGLEASISIGESVAKPGGGTLPESGILSVTLDVIPNRMTLDQFATALRRSTPPILGYIAEGRFKLDLRTVLPDQDEIVVRELKSALASGVAAHKQENLWPDQLQ
jgi:L-seryl-tRNA(Ser) seleniumtransferase